MRARRAGVGRAAPGIGGPPPTVPEERPEWDRLLFHIDEAMSWESIRDLDRMRTTLIVIRYIAAGTDGDGVDDVKDGIEEVTEILVEVLAQISTGKTL